MCACLSPGGTARVFLTRQICAFSHIAQLARYFVWLCYHKDKDICLFWLSSLWISIYCIKPNTVIHPVPMAMQVNMFYCNMIWYRLYPYLIMMQLIKFIAQPTRIKTWNTAVLPCCGCLRIKQWAPPSKQFIQVRYIPHVRWIKTSL